MNVQAEHPYDLFISYVETDRDWVEKYLLDALSSAGVRCCTEAAFALGAPRLAEFERAIRESRRTLLVLSPAYLAEGFAQFTDLLAQSYGLETATWPVIPLVLRPVELPPRLAMLIALDATDPASWSEVIKRLCAEFQRPVPPPPAKPPCPYPGMLPFSEADAGRFFGRKREVQELLERLRLHPFLTVIGPSGSGKSSLLHAGLIPGLRQSDLFRAADWRILTLRPGPQPLQSLAAVLGQHVPDSQADIVVKLAQEPGSLKPYLDSVAAAPDTYCLLLVDQFEEVFAQCKDPARRRTFLERLREVIENPPDRCLIILAVRADFYADCQESILWPHIEASLLNLPPLAREDLRRAIEQPAQAVGVCLEPALVERLLDDAADEKGVLPLLQATLRLMWSHFLRRRLLILADYEALGSDGRSGMQVALSRSADAALAALTNDEQRAVARRIFLRLIEFGEGRNDTRRQQPVEALATESDAEQVFRTVLEHLVQHRLLTTGSDVASGAVVVDLAHEKLIEAWPRLRDWLESYQTMEVMRRSLVLAATAWRENGQDPSYLFTGKRLRQAIEWAKQWGQELCAPERTFLAASQALGRRRRVRTLVASASIAAIAVAALTLLGRAGYREWVRRTTGTPLVALPGGPAIVGTDDPAAEPEEQPRRTVNLLPFQIEPFEVTNRQYRACDERGPCSPPSLTDAYDDPAQADLPVVYVTAQQARVYCAWLGRRLPTTVEWERAARGAEGRLWPWGDSDPTPDRVRLWLDAYPDYAPEGPIAVDSMPEGATPEGIHHLVGNVWEWVVVAPEGCEGALCHQPWDGQADRAAIMGGGYEGYLDRVTQFTRSVPNIPDAFIGFRCAADASAR